MKASAYYVVLVTAPDKKTARALSRAALQARLAACVNLLPGVESHYWWKAKLQTGFEVLMIFKTTKRCLPALKKMILQKHPYETPELVALEINFGSKAYLDWIAESVS